MGTPRFACGDGGTTGGMLAWRPRGDMHLAAAAAKRRAYAVAKTHAACPSFKTSRRCVALY